MLDSDQMALLADGALSVNVDVVDAAGNMANVSTNSFSLDTTSDVGGDLMITIDDVDGFVNEDEAPMTSYTVAGLDADGMTTALVTFSDGDVANDVTATISEDGTFSADLSDLDQGNITVTIVATDLAGNTDGTASDMAILDTIDPEGLVTTSSEGIDTTTDEYVEPNTSDPDASNVLTALTGSDPNGAYEFTLATNPGNAFVLSLIHI